MPDDFKPNIGKSKCWFESKQNCFGIFIYRKMTRHGHWGHEFTTYVWSLHDLSVKAWKIDATKKKVKKLNKVWWPHQQQLFIVVMNIWKEIYTDIPFSHDFFYSLPSLTYTQSNHLQGIWFSFYFPSEYKSPSTLFSSSWRLFIVIALRLRFIVCKLAIVVTSRRKRASLLTKPCK